ncbi:MAG: histone-like nucleoid-structuring protein Lsr2 [Brevibacterium aurantiacum]|uniref:histone-like nucleoid-structuring protein Lsr2 n=1 Tax=Brevibacterium aurantiacum TaxID=273384 RepID=UPI003F9316FB
MARKFVSQITDDIDGQILSEEDSESVQYSIEGRHYEIDLGPANAKKFREALEPYVSVSRKVSAPGRTRQSRSRTSRPGRGLDMSAVRAWARENGHTVPDRGRVPNAVLDAYEAAH